MIDDLESNCIKVKLPSEITFIRNEDGTYRVFYKDLAFIDTTNNKIIFGSVDIPRAEMSWGNSIAFPTPIIKKLLVSNESNKLFTIIEEERK
jgi:hypothetical protein